MDRRQPVEDYAADGVQPLPHPPAFAAWLASSSLEKARRRRSVGCPGAQSRRVGPLLSVTKDEAQELATKPGVTVLRADVNVPKLDHVATIPSRGPGHVGEADVAALTLHHVQHVAVIKVVQQLQRDLGGGWLDRLPERRHLLPHLAVGAYRKPGDRRHVRQRCPSEGAEGRRHAAARRRVAAPAEVAGCGNLREGRGVNSGLLKRPALGGRLQGPWKKLRKRLLSPWLARQYDGGMAGRAADAVVVGAGVIGLSTGICLAEAGRKVRIYTADVPAQTASAAAVAMVGPALTPPGYPAAAWERTTIEEFTKLAQAPATGVHICRGRLAAREGPAGSPPRFEACRPEELPDGFATGFWATLPLVDMPRYLAYLADRFQSLGGAIEVRRIRTLAEAAEGADLVANCSGVGARYLVPDASVRPVRGQQVIVENPGLDAFFIEAAHGAAWAGYHPHGHYVTLGGVAAVDDWNRDPDPTVAEEIRQRCIRVEPRLAGARVLGHRVGLRPGRSSVRLEVQELGSARVVHNYGHGSVGVMLSWGCAREAVALLLRERPPAGR